MNRYVVLSVNENPQYVFYAPLVTWAWKKLGWTPIILYTDETKEFAIARHFMPMLPLPVNFHRLAVEGYKSETVAQISRLYAACPYGHKEDYLMTSDIDMLPLSDYWRPDPEKITVWGHDLTGYQHMPICYIGMKRTRWVEVMGLTNHRYNELIKRDLDSIPNAKSEDSVKRWVVDQDLITDKINAVTFEKEFISRGTLPNGYPNGRVDRSAWSLEHPQLIDCHMLRDIYVDSDTGRANLAKTMRLLEKVWPEENFDWFMEYTKNFRDVSR